MFLTTLVYGALLYACGWQPYSVRIGDSYYSFSRLEPLGTLLGIAVDAVEMSEHMTDDEANNLGSLIMGSVSKNLVSKHGSKARPIC